MADINPHKDSLLNFVHQKMNKEFKATAPKELWDDIAQDLPQGSNNEPMDFDQQLQAKISEFKAPAPAQLWSNILDGIETSSSDELLDEKVREAFGIQAQAPDKIWHQIDHQLSIDQIWRDMTPRLNQLRKKYLWRKRLRQLSVAAVFLLLLKTCVPDFGGNAPQPLAKKESTSVNLQQIQAPAIQNNLWLFPEINKFIQEKSEQKDKAKKDDLLSTQMQIPSATNREEQAFAEGQPLAELTVEDKPINHSNNHAAHLATILPTIHKQETLQAEKLEYETGQENKKPDAIYLRALTAKELPLQSLTDPVPTTKKQLKVFRSYTQAGLIVSAHKSQITNDVNTKAIQGVTEDVEVNSPYAMGYGLNVEHFFAPKHGLSMELWVKAQHRQRYNFTYRGKPVHKDLKVKYTKLAMAYRLNFLNYGALQQHQLVFKPGAYLSHLNSYSESYSSAGIRISNPSFNTWNAGLQFSLGQQHLLFKHRVALEYGLRSEIGLNNVTQQVVANNNSSSSNNLLNWGLYTALRYQF